MQRQPARPNPTAPWARQRQHGRGPRATNPQTQPEPKSPGRSPTSASRLVATPGFSVSADPRVPDSHASCTLGDRGKNVAPGAEAGVAAEAGARSRAGRRAGAQVESAAPRRTLHRDPGQGGGVPVGHVPPPGAVDLDPLRDAEVPRCWSLGIACQRAPSDRGCESPRTRLSGHCPVSQTHYSTANEKVLQMQAFSEAAEGIRTLDLLHGKQNLPRRFRMNMPAKQGVSGHPGPSTASRHFPGNHGGFRTETGPSLAPPRPRNWGNER
jgi:hypothetical protein